jgi:hypothetical protein
MTEQPDDGNIPGRPDPELTQEPNPGVMEPVLDDKLPHPTQDEQGVHDDPEAQAEAALETDPSGGGPERLAGDMGISSERVGHVQGGGEATHGAAPTQTPGPLEGEDVPEKSADGIEPEPANALPPHRFDRRGNPGHSHG